VFDPAPVKMVLPSQENYLEKRILSGLNFHRALDTLFFLDKKADDQDIITAPHREPGESHKRNDKAPGSE
jgi:hypothetical protein